MSEKIKVGQDVVVTIFGKSRAGKVTDIAVRGSYDAMTLYRIDGDGWYRESNLKPLETKFEIGDLVRVRVPDWGLGSGETDFTDFVEKVNFSSVGGAPTYTVRGRVYGGGWVSAVELENKFKVGDIVCPNWAEDSTFRVTKVGFPGGVDSIKMTLDGREDNLSDIWMKASAYKLAPTSRYKFDIGDMVEYVGSEPDIKYVTGKVVGRGLTTGGTQHYTVTLNGTDWTVTERELTGMRGDNAAGIKGLASRVEKLEDTVYRKIVPGDFKVGEKVNVADFKSTYVVFQVTDSGRLNLKYTLNDPYLALTEVNPKDVTPYVEDVWESKNAYALNLGDVVKFDDTTMVTVVGVTQGGSYNSYVTVLGTTSKGYRFEKLFAVDGEVKVKKNG